MNPQAPQSGLTLVTDTIANLQRRGYKVGGVLRNFNGDTSLEFESRVANFSSAVHAARLAGLDVIVVANVFGEDWMHREPRPNTYQVRLCRPFGALTKNPYLFNLHAESRHAALSWVERIFTGIDVRPTLYRWSGGRVAPVGNDDPVSIIDCDHFTSASRVGGKLVRRELAPGQYRHTGDQVFEGLEKIQWHLAEERDSKVESFSSMSLTYMREPKEWVYERLQEIKQGAEKADRWHTNLSREIERMRPQRQAKALEMPQVLHLVQAA